MTLRDTRNKLSTCHPDVVKLVLALADETDVLVVCGHRTQAEQDDAYKRKATKLKWPRSGHNSLPSRAVDLAPWPLDWNDRDAFLVLQKKIRALATKHGIALEPMITWDLPHVELKRGAKK